jgi:hypothetical protein
MFSKSMRSIYRRLLILGLFSGCLLYFGYLDKIKTVSAAAPCEQECEELKAMCLDDCAEGALACDENSTDSACTSCISSCSSGYNSCMASATWCGDYTQTYEPQCQVNFGAHCPIVNNQVRCDLPAAHYGYSLVCKTLGDNHCIRCPDHDRCVGGGYQSCP